MKVVCVGDCGVDHYLPTGDVLVGGITANFARHAKNEFPDRDVIQVVSAVGDDNLGTQVLATLDASGIDCHISQLSGTTPVQYIDVRADGERQFVRYEAGVLGDYRIGKDEQNIIAQSDLLVAPIYSQIAELFKQLMSIEREGLTAVDFTDFSLQPDYQLLEQLIARIDFGFFGLDAADVEILGRLEFYSRETDMLFVVTLGAEGSRVYYGGQQFHCAAVPVESVIDTTGAGDSFAAAFLSRHCHGANIQDSLAAGSELAAKVVQLRGWA